MNGEATKTYTRSIAQVCDYISAHLDEDLSVEKLSRIAHFSKYHFHRQFSEYTGINVARFILMARLKRASYQLVFNKRSRITDIAMDAKFENPESFSRAFKTTFGQTPSQFRQHPAWLPWHAQYQFPTIARNVDMNIQLVEFATTKVAVLEHRGAPELLNDSVSSFIEWRKTSKLSPVATSLSLGVAYDDPKATAPENFRFDICGSVDADVPANPQGVVTRLIPGGRCALVRHLGSRDAMDEKIYYLYGKWLPSSGEELRDFPCFFHYLNLFPEVPEHALITDIYLPLK